MNDNAKFTEEQAMAAMERAFELYCGWYGFESARRIFEETAAGMLQRNGRDMEQVIADATRKVLGPRKSADVIQFNGKD